MNARSVAMLVAAGLLNVKTRSVSAHEGEDLLSGFMRPIPDWDHVLAMIAFAARPPVWLAASPAGGRPAPLALA